MVDSYLRLQWVIILMTLLWVITIMIIIMLLTTAGRFTSQITVGDHVDGLVVG